MPSGPLDGLVRKLSLHSRLAQADRDAIVALPVRQRGFQAHAYFVREGEPPDMCAVLLDGYVYRQKTTRAGTRQIVGLHIPGDAIDLQNLYLDVADHNVQALTRIELAILSPRDVSALALARPAIARALVRDLLIEAAILREWVLNVGRRDARARLAHLLSEFAVRLDAVGLSGRDGYALPMTQEQLGDALGLTPIHVNRTLRTLEAEGLIARDGRVVTFPDWRRLSDVADFDPRYLHIGAEPGSDGETLPIAARKVEA